MFLSLDHPHFPSFLCPVYHKVLYFPFFFFTFLSILSLQFLLMSNVLYSLMIWNCSYGLIPFPTVNFSNIFCIYFYYILFCFTHLCSLINFVYIKFLIFIIFLLYFFIHNLFLIKRIEEICCKAHKVLGFILWSSSEFYFLSSFKALYCASICLVLEYGSILRDPFIVNASAMVERV